MTDTLDHTETREKPKRRHRSPHGLGLYVTDLELIEHLGVPPETASLAIRMLDKDTKSGFPPKQKLWGYRRYLPAVEAWLDKVNGLKMDLPRRDKQ